MSEPRFSQTAVGIVLLGALASALGSVIYDSWLRSIEEKSNEPAAVRQGDKPETVAWSPPQLAPLLALPGERVNISVPDQAAGAVTQPPEVTGRPLAPPTAALTQPADVTSLSLAPQDRIGVAGLADSNKTKFSDSASPNVDDTPTTVRVVIPANQELRVRLTQPLGSATSQVEDQFEAQLTKDIEVRGAKVLAAGIRLYGEVTAVTRPGRVQGRASIGLRLHRADLPDGSIVEVSTAPVKRERSSVKKDVLRTLMTTAVGAGAGAAVRGRDGAAKGATGGAAAGVGVAIIDPGDEVVLPVGAEIQFRLRTSLAVPIYRMP